MLEAMEGMLYLLRCYSVEVVFNMLEVLEDVRCAPELLEGMRRYWRLWKIVHYML